MALESLSYRHHFTITGFPLRWIPLIHLYDPDLPLFPLYYVHRTLPLPANRRPSATDRVFGYVEKINVDDAGNAEITFINNKDLSLPAYSDFRDIAEDEVRERFGMNNPVTQADIDNVFKPPFENKNKVLTEFWYRVVQDAYGDKLPFGRLFDEVFGLIRFVSSFYPPNGRKSEFIQTHYFVKTFGERIQASNNIPQVDFYLLPSKDEFLNATNPLSHFSKFKEIQNAADAFQRINCTEIDVSPGNKFSKFTNGPGGNFDTTKLHSLFDELPGQHSAPLYEAYNAFDKGPTRTILFLMMVSDIRHKRYNVLNIDNITLGKLYDKALDRSYQSPKVIHIYLQQCIGYENAFPMDTWIKSFMEAPLNIIQQLGKVRPYQRLLSNTDKLGKLERLIWVTCQARKVHSNACNDAAWCLKRASNKDVRSANPLACRICTSTIRNECPSYAAIKNHTVYFNTDPLFANSFRIYTSEGVNHLNNQKIKKAESYNKKIVDDFSTVDSPVFKLFPVAGHNGDTLTVEEFIDQY